MRAEYLACIICSSIYLLFSYVFDGKPPDLKKKELAKRYTIVSLACWITLFASNWVIIII